MPEHDDRLEDLEAEVRGLREWKVGIMIEHETLKAGVSNFRSFQVDARDFFTRADERAKNEESFHNKRDQEIKDAFEKRHLENTERLDGISAGISKKTLIWNIAGVLVGIAAIVVAVCICYLTMKSSHTTDLRQLFLHSRSAQVLSYSQPQDAGNSVAVHY